MDICPQQWSKQWPGLYHLDSQGGSQASSCPCQEQVEQAAKKCDDLSAPVLLALSQTDPVWFDGKKQGKNDDVDREPEGPLSDEGGNNIRNPFGSSRLWTVLDELTIMRQALSNACVDRSKVNTSLEAATRASSRDL